MKFSSMTCNACGDKFFCPRLIKHSYLNCLTAPGGYDPERLPAKCWQLRCNDSGLVKEALLLLGVKKQINTSYFSKLKAVVAVLIDHPLLNDDTVNALQKVFDDGLDSDKLARSLSRQKCPTIAKFISENFYSVNNKFIAQKQLALVFRKELQAYTDHCWSKFHKKRERGHKVVERSIIRGLLSSQAFCFFIQDKGYTSWLEVSQRDVDEYLLLFSRATARYAGHFLKFVFKKQNINKKVVLPKANPIMYSEKVLNDQNMENIVSLIDSYTCLEQRVIALFLAIYAQPIEHSLRLRFSNFKYHNNQLQVLFNEEWLPLDDKTASLLLTLKPELALPVKKQDERIFSYGRSYFLSKIKESGYGANEIRLGAIARLIRLGSMKRGAICAFFGVSFPTLSAIERTMEWDLQQTVEQDVIEKRNRMIKGEYLNE